MCSNRISPEPPNMPATAASVPQAARRSLPRISTDWVATLVALALAALAWSGLLPRVGW